MISKETLRQVVNSQKKEITKEQQTVRREILDKIMHWMDDSRVIILSGIRRCGKSTILKQLMTKTKEWSYVNFEDERLLKFEAQDFELLNEVLTEVYGKTSIYFFDEIQNVEKFETFVRRLQDQGKKIIITGSNATLLSKEFGTKLTGRYKLFEVYPFSFLEYLELKKTSFKTNDWYDLDKKIKLLEHFKKYLTEGGFPEYLKNQDHDYIKTVLENILYKDIITRYSIRKEKTIKELVNILATNNTLQITYNALKKTLNLSNAITVKEYISYLNNSYLFFELAKISFSLKEQLNSPKKIFIIDSAFHQVCGSGFTPNKGRALENSIFIDLKRKGNEIYYFSKTKECDFIIKEGTKITKAIQVCHTLDDSNRKRELEGLSEAMDVFNLDIGTIITMEQTEEITLNKHKIKVIPALNWMTEN